jgi:hypothetical protein
VELHRQGLAGKLKPHNYTRRLAKPSEHDKLRLISSSGYVRLHEADPTPYRVASCVTELWYLSLHGQRRLALAT